MKLDSCVNIKYVKHFIQLIDNRTSPLLRPVQRRLWTINIDVNGWV